MRKTRRPLLVPSWREFAENVRRAAYLKAALAA